MTTDGQRVRGVVARWIADKGFGFIAPEHGGPNVFVHHREIQASGVSALREEQEVEFAIGEDHKGRRCAVQVVPVENDSRTPYR